MDSSSEPNPYTSTDSISGGLPSGNELVLYSKNQISAAALLAGPFAGAFLGYKNLSRLGKASESHYVLGIGLIVSAILIFLIYFLPDDFNFTGISVGAAIGTRFLVVGYMKSELSEHFSNGGNKERWMKVIGLSVALAIPFVISVVLVGMGLGRF